MRYKIITFLRKLFSRPKPMFNSVDALRDHLRKEYAEKGIPDTLMQSQCEYAKAEKEGRTKFVTDDDLNEIYNSDDENDRE